MNNVSKWLCCRSPEHDQDNESDEPQSDFVSDITNDYGVTFRDPTIISLISTFRCYLWNERDAFISLLHSELEGVLTEVESGCAGLYLYIHDNVRRHKLLFKEDYGSDINSICVGLEEHINSSALYILHNTRIMRKRMINQAIDENEQEIHKLYKKQEESLEKYIRAIDVDQHALVSMECDPHHYFNSIFSLYSYADMINNIHNNCVKLVESLLERELENLKANVNIHFEGTRAMLSQAIRKPTRAMSRSSLLAGLVDASSIKSL